MLLQLSANILIVIIIICNELNSLIKTENVKEATKQLQSYVVSIKNVWPISYRTAIDMLLSETALYEDDELYFTISDLTKCKVFLRSLCPQT